MLDPIPPPPSWLSSSIASLSATLSFPTLPLHVHELIASFLFYQFVQTVISPLVSSYLFPSVYPQLNRRTKINWDVHVVSLVQSCSINAAALWVMYVDEERMDMSAMERVYGYTGGCGMIQGLAAGYFLWDLVVTSRNVGIFGWGMWAHGVCALCVFSFGFRPFLNFYGPTFILYELSSPFLNIHWFLDKLHLTGSKYQWYNGIILLASFFGCRLVWGTYQSIRVYQDVWAALHLPINPATGELDYLAMTTGSNVTRGAQDLFVPRDGRLCLGREECVAAQSEVMKFVGAGTRGIPIWLAVTYLSSNVVLNSLNFYWFGKMIETVRKRFDNKPKEKDEASRADDGEKKKKDEKREAVRRRKSSIVLDVADGLQRSMMDGSGDTDGSVAAGGSEMARQVREKMNAEQRRDLEDEMEHRAKSSALENHNAATAATAAATTTTFGEGDAARRR
ncbi:hypothetical protein GJ744_011987 [Endocarpon pusillum]|uniref:TLC domain-containing protein n=1 Tax=Endocarpon pusillum TaxID=364733 RepID=A0A8H7ASS5_9EURO|nr:hypothetical protein GJ744_011987 [Endocarpon pusillum]